MKFVLFLSIFASIEATTPAGNELLTTSSPNTNNEWVIVSREVRFFKDTPEELRKFLRGNTVEFDIFADPPVYPPGKSAKDYRGMRQEFGLTDLS